MNKKYLSTCRDVRPLCLDEPGLIESEVLSPRERLLTVSEMLNALESVDGWDWSAAENLMSMGVGDALQEFLALNGFSRLLALLDQKGADYARQVLGVLERLPWVRACVNAFVEERGIPTLLSFLSRSSDYVVQKKVVSILSRVASHDQAAQQISDGDGVSLFGGVLKEGDGLHFETAAWTLRCIAGSESGAEKIVRLVGPDVLLRHMESSTDSAAVCHLAWAVGATTRYKPGLEAAVHVKAPNRLLTYMERATDPKVIYDISGALLHITSSDEGRAVLTRINGPVRLARCLERCHCPKTVRNLGWSLFNVSSVEGVSQSLLDDIGPNRLLAILASAAELDRGTGSSVSRPISDCFTKIVSRPQLAAAIAGNNGVKVVSTMILTTLEQGGGMDSIEALVYILRELLRGESSPWENTFDVDDLMVVMRAVSQASSESVVWEDFKAIVTHVMGPEAGTQVLAISDRLGSLFQGAGAQTGPMMCAVMTLLGRQVTELPIRRDTRVFTQVCSNSDGLRALLSWVSAADGRGSNELHNAGNNRFSALVPDLEEIVFSYVDAHTASMWLLTLIQHHDDRAFLAKFGRIVQVLRGHDWLVSQARELVCFAAEHGLTPQRCIANIDRALGRSDEGVQSNRRLRRLTALCSKILRAINTLRFG